MALLARRLLQAMSLETYQEGPNSTFTHLGNTYPLDPFLVAANDLPTEHVPMREVVWVLEHGTADPQRVAEADLKVPALAVEDPKWGLVVIDGFHRLTKAKRQGKSAFAIKRVPPEWFGKIAPIDAS